MFEAFDENTLDRFDEGKLRDHQIQMMLINAIKKIESAINVLRIELDEVKKR
jgi:hypothetical protein